MPQLNDTFIDRMIDLISRSADAQYRQRIVNDYRRAMEAVIPLEQAVAYDTMLLADTRASDATRVGATTTSAEIESIRAELRGLATRMNEIYREISRNIYSTSQLVTTTSPPLTRVRHAVDLSRLSLWGIVVMLLALPAIVIGCLLHNRVREEEERSEFVSARA